MRVIRSSHYEMSATPYQSSDQDDSLLLMIEQSLDFVGNASKRSISETHGLSKWCLSCGHIENAEAEFKALIPAVLQRCIAASTIRERVGPSVVLEVTPL